MKRITAILLVALGRENKSVYRSSTIAVQTHVESLGRGVFSPEKRGNKGCLGPLKRGYILNAESGRRIIWIHGAKKPSKIKGFRHRWNPANCFCNTFATRCFEKTLKRQKM